MTANVRATFDLNLAGHADEVEQATEKLFELLTEEGFIFDEDFSGLYDDDEYNLTGARLYTIGAISTALRLVPDIGAYLIVANEELLDDSDLSPAGPVS